MNHTLLLIILLTICWTITPFLKKQASSKLSSSEYMIFNHGLCTILIVVYFIYLLYNNKCKIDCIKKLNSKEIIIISLGAITTVLASLVLIKLLKENDTSDIRPYIQPCVIILTILIGYFIFNENITKYKILGIILIIVGLLVIGKKN